MKKITKAVAGLVGIITAGAAIQLATVSSTNIGHLYFKYRIPMDFKIIEFNSPRSLQSGRQGFYDPATHRVYITSDNAREIAEIWIPQGKREAIFESLRNVRKVTKDDAGYQAFTAQLRP